MHVSIDDYRLWTAILNQNCKLHRVLHYKQAVVNKCVTL